MKHKYTSKVFVWNTWYEDTAVTTQTLGNFFLVCHRQPIFPLTSLDFEQGPSTFESQAYPGALDRP